jgi:hypothetical protein
VHHQQIVQLLESQRIGYPAHRSVRRSTRPSPEIEDLHLAERRQSGDLAVSASRFSAHHLTRKGPVAHSWLMPPFRLRRRLRASQRAGAFMDATQAWQGHKRSRRKCGAQDLEGL